VPSAGIYLTSRANFTNYIGILLKKILIACEETMKVFSQPCYCKPTFPSQ
jgi:hypothetical protein